MSLESFLEARGYTDIAAPALDLHSCLFALDLLPFGQKWLRGKIFSLRVNFYPPKWGLIYYIYILLLRSKDIRRTTITILPLLHKEYSLR